MEEVADLAERVGTRAACEALGVPRATFYRREKAVGAKERPLPPLALSTAERQEVLDTLHKPRFYDRAPGEVHATLLDEGVYLCSERTMYRILEQAQETQERRRGHQHRVFQKPELLATRPNQVWSWDITKLKGPRTWSYFYLYVILDIFSRFVVGWMVAERENSEYAKKLIDSACEQQRITPGQLTLHSDRGPSMTSQPVAGLLGQLGITKTHNRPYVSNDNPYSESQFKTLKYSPWFPERFYLLEEARGYCTPFFHWYNFEHRHSGLQMLTPAVVHAGEHERVLAARQRTMREAFMRNPARFKYSVPAVKPLDTEVWINKPQETAERKVA